MLANGGWDLIQRLKGQGHLRLTTGTACVFVCSLVLHIWYERFV